MKNDAVTQRKTRGAGRGPSTRPAARPGSRAEVKRQKILDTAMRHFAEHGYHAARVEDIAKALGIAKGSIFQHFISKDGLFLETYKKAVRALPKYLDAPPEVVKSGFFAIVRYWLEHTEHLIHEDWVRFRVAILGDYGTDLPLKREINRFLIAEDPYGTSAFVRKGIEWGEVRSDIEPEMITSMVDWMTERFQDAIITEELDPGLLRRHGSRPERMTERIDHFIDMLRGAIGGH
jgi:AcrR family transcriptional regulator